MKIVDPLPKEMWGMVCKELQTRLILEVIEECCREWRRPIVPVPKTEGVTWFCIDFRKVNARSCFDTYPMPQLDELLERAGITK